VVLLRRSDITAIRRVILLLCTLSLMLAQGPLHLGFAHTDHADTSAESIPKCQEVKVHFEPDESTGIEPETDCLACQQMGRYVHADKHSVILPVPRIISVFSYETPFKLACHLFINHLRGPPLA